MKIQIAGDQETGWELLFTGEQEPLCIAENIPYLQALDAFAANHPEYADQLDVLRDEYIDLVGLPAVKEKQRRTSGPVKQRKRGSSARFRELILAGKSNEECLRIVREEFPESKATLSDAAWNRAQLRKNPSGYGPDGEKV